MSITSTLGTYLQGSKHYCSFEIESGIAQGSFWEICKWRRTAILVSGSFYLLYQTLQIGVRHIVYFRLIIDSHQRNSNFILTFLLQVISNNTSTPTLTFAFRGNCHTVLVGMFSQ